MAKTDVALRDAGAVQIETANETSAPILNMLQKVIDRPDVPVERLKAMFDLYRDVEADQSRKDFTASLVAAQSEMEPVRKDASNQNTKSKYATFEALDRAIRPAYTKHGFAPSYNTEQSDQPDHVRVVLTLMHKAGHERRYTADMPADGKGAKGGDVMTKTHAFGSAFSYGKRYLLAGAFNVIATERDDDGNAAGNATLNEDQIKQIEKLIKDTGANREAFLGMGGFEDVKDIPQSQFNAAISKLKMFAKQVKK